MLNAYAWYSANKIWGLTFREARSELLHFTVTQNSVRVRVYLRKATDRPYKRTATGMGVLLTDRRLPVLTKMFHLTSSLRLTWTEHPNSWALSCFLWRYLFDSLGYTIKDSLGFRNWTCQRDWMWCGSVLCRLKPAVWVKVPSTKFHANTGRQSERQ
jgi:hypothetical protein